MKHWYGFAIVGLCLLLERTSCALQKGAIEQKKTANYLVKENSVARVSQVEINTNYDPKKATTATARRPTVQQPKILINGQPIQNFQSLVQQIKPTVAKSSKRVQQVLVIQQPQRVVQQTVASAPKTQIIKLQKIVQQVQPKQVLHGLKSSYNSHNVYSRFSEPGQMHSALKSLYSSPNVCSRFCEPVQTVSGLKSTYNSLNVCSRFSELGQTHSEHKSTYNSPNLCNRFSASEQTQSGRKSTYNSLNECSRFSESGQTLPVLKSSYNSLSVCNRFSESGLTLSRLGSTLNNPSVCSRFSVSVTLQVLHKHK
uniref:Uncharacterized protein n=1 Tax=Anopheles merus TaxID=30066 RepID=A0A182V1L1_ANOME